MIKLILFSWFWVIIIMLLTWLIYLWRNNPGIVDVAWSLAIMLAGLNYLFSTPMTNIQTMLMLLLMIWGLRLAGYLLLTRIMPGKIEKRYLSLSEQWQNSKSWRYLINYQSQGILAVIIASPFLFIRQLSHVSFWQICAIILIIAGIIGEIIADQQLQQFKRQYNNKVCNVGLWYYSRHPNYFFEWMIWLGFGIAALSVNYGWIGLISPALLLFLMLTITGPITERQSIKSRGKAYLDYQQSTSMFFPLPPKRAS